MTSSGHSGNFFAQGLCFKHTRKEDVMKKPNGKDLLATLVNLLADQEGVKIEYELEECAE